MVTQNGSALVIAVLGLGEAGSVIARDLAAAGARVRGYDPALTAAEPVLDTASEAEAARGAQLVLSVNSAKAAVDAFRAGLPLMASACRALHERLAEGESARQAASGRVADTPFAK